MILSDADLRRAIELGTLVVEPFEPKRVQPASIDLTLGDEFAEWPTSGLFIDLDDPVVGPPDMVRAKHPKGFELRPGAFALASTVEVIGLAPMFCARVEGRSSLGRLGLCVHATAGFVDPGFKGNITLELYNMSPHVLLLSPGMTICQLAVQMMTGAAERPYGAERGSKYQGQDGATPSRWRGSAGEGG